MTRTSLNCIAAFLAAFCGPALAQAASAGCDPGFSAQARQVMDAFLAKDHAPGVVVAFHSHSRDCILAVGKSRINGPAMTEATEFAMGSVQKVFTTTLLALAIDHGKANITDPAARYLVAGNDARVRPGAAFTKVTLRNLVTHTSALPRQPPGARATSKTLFLDQPLPAKVITFLDNWRPSYPIGSKYVYSNFGMVLAAEAVVHIYGTPYTRLLVREVTGPLGMQGTGMFCQRPAPDCAEVPQMNGRPGRLPVGLWTNGHDLLQFVRANLAAPGTPQQLARALELAHREQFRENPDHATGMAWERWHRGDRVLLAKDGWDSGYGTWIGIEPKLDTGVAVLSLTRDKSGAGHLGKALLALVQQH